MDKFEKLFGKDGLMRLSDLRSYGSGVGGRVPNDIADSVYFFIGTEKKTKTTLKIFVGKNILKRLGIPADSRIDFVWSRKEMVGGIYPSQNGYKLQDGYQKHAGEKRTDPGYSFIIIRHKTPMPLCEKHKYVKMQSLTLDTEDRTIIFNMPAKDVFF